MSADSLNGSPYKKPPNGSPIDDRTYNKNEEEKESACERISQVSPFIVSPSDTDATRPSTLSRTTAPTDAKASKPDETHCLSKATSIDSWCSNDTLYNVEENFDDLALDPEPSRDHSASSDTLTHDDDRSRCDTYVVADASRPGAFSPDSISDHRTYTRDTPPSHRDLAYGTLMSGLPSYSNCTTELASGRDDWRLPQPELVRRSPAPPHPVDIAPPVPLSDDRAPHAPRLPAPPRVHKMDSVEITCLHDELDATEIADSPGCHYDGMAPSVTSTPLAAADAPPDAAAIPMQLPPCERTPDFPTAVPAFRAFAQSAEVRPQDVSPDTQDTEALLEAESAAQERTPDYSDFESSALTRAQEPRSAASVESGISSDDFRHFETSVRSRPQDLSSVIDASSLLLSSERRFGESLGGGSPAVRPEPGRSRSRATDPDPIESLVVVPPSDTNLVESQRVAGPGAPGGLYAAPDEEETEQPHSIIMTERDVLKDTPNRTYDSHAEGPLVDLNHTYDSHAGRFLHLAGSDNDSHRRDPVQVNGIEKNDVDFDKKSPKVSDLLGLLDVKSPKEEVRESVTSSPAVVAESAPNKSDRRLIGDIEEIKCNGNSQKYATVEFLSETFEELIESNVDDGDCKDFKPDDVVEDTPNTTEMITPESSEPISPVKEMQELSKESQSLEDFGEEEVTTNGVRESDDDKLTSVTENFLQNEKKFCQLDAYFPLLSDIRFTGEYT